MSLKKIAARLTLSLLAALSLAAHANETIRKVVETKFEVKVRSITKTNHLGLYEVVAGNQIIYSDEKATAFFLGNVIDAKTDTNVTESRLLEIGKQTYKPLIPSLPLDLAVKQVRGNGKGMVITFEDPNCGYCKKLARDIQTLKDVTIYTFVLPILGENSTKKAKDILCSTDRVKVWNDWMINNTTPAAAKADCKVSMDKIMMAGRSFEVTGTPTLVFSDGTRIPGAVPVAEIERKLAELAKKPG